MSRQYWDSSVWVAILNREAKRVETCKAAYQRAEQGDVTLVISSITLAEVIKVDRDYPNFGSDQHETLEMLFRGTHIHVWNVDRRTAEQARTYMWQHNLKHRDAVHAATAYFADVDEFFSYDTDLTRLDGTFTTVGGKTPRVREPYVSQPPIDFPTE